MFDTIILLTSAAEQTALSAALRRHKPGLAMIGAATFDELAAIGGEQLARARLIAFATAVIVPRAILDALGYGAYNFHPGPPEYPGWLPGHFARYDRAANFGVTAHVMTPKVDAGPIIAVRRFATPPGDLMALEQEAFGELARLFWDLAPALATSAEPLPVLPLTWGPKKSTRRDCLDLCQVPPTVEIDDLDRRIAAFGGGYIGVLPEIRIGDHIFRYVQPNDGQRTTT